LGPETRQSRIEEGSLEEDSSLRGYWKKKKESKKQEREEGEKIRQGVERRGQFRPEGGDRRS
jgi:hypothetical protein